jgi:hypothetical protein
VAKAAVSVSLVFVFLRAFVVKSPSERSRKSEFLTGLLTPLCEKLCPVLSATCRDFSLQGGHPTPLAIVASGTARVFVNA